MSSPENPLGSRADQWRIKLEAIETFRAPWDAENARFAWQYRVIAGHFLRAYAGEIGVPSSRVIDIYERELLEKSIQKLAPRRSL